MTDEPVARYLAQQAAGAVPKGADISNSMRYQRTLENYLKAGFKPRWMERVMDIDRGVKEVTARMAKRHAAVAAECMGDAELFAQRWTEVAERVRFDALNLLITQHNEWYPIERDLPMDPRTGDYRPISGRSYRRRHIDAGWILEHFPPHLPA